MFLQGNHQIVEMAYQRTKDFDRLSFLYLITGNLDKLRKMTKIAEIRKDVSSQFLGALYLGDVEERVKLLKNSDQMLLAYLTAATHGLKEEAVELIELCGPNLPKVNPKAALLRPPVPITQAETNWPLLTMSKSFFEGPAAVASATSKRSAVAAEMDDDAGLEVIGGEGWDADLELDDEEPGTATTKKAESAEVEDEDAGWDVGDDEVELPPDLVTTGDKEDKFFVCPTTGVPDFKQWLNSSQLPIDHIQAGSFRTAFRLLHEQIGVINFAPFRQIFLYSFARSRTVYTPLPLSPPLFVYPHRTVPDSFSKTPYPAVLYKLSSLIDDLQTCYQVTTAGKFSEAVEKFRTLMLTVPLLIVDTKKDYNEALELLRISKNYVLALQMEITRKDLPKRTIEEQLRVCELSAYFTHCELQPVHEILTLRSAVNLFFKMKNYKTAASFARRLLELGPRPDVSQQARKILQACEKKPDDEHRIEYDERNPFSICGYSYKPIYRGRPEEKCAFCSTSYLPEHKSKVCNVCKVAEIGKNVSGIRISLERF